MNDVVVNAAEADSRERLRAFAAAVEHRDAMHRLASELKTAFTFDEVGRIVAEMKRVGDEYESWLRAETARMMARTDQRAQMITADAIA